MAPHPTEDTGMYTLIIPMKPRTPCNQVNLAYKFLARILQNPGPVVRASKGFPQISATEWRERWWWRKRLHSQLALREWGPAGEAPARGTSAAEALSKRSARTRSWRRRSWRGGEEDEEEEGQRKASQVEADARCGAREAWAPSPSHARHAPQASSRRASSYPRPSSPSR